MNLSLDYDTSGLFEDLTFILAYRNGNKIGVLSKPQDLIYKDSIESAPEISMTIYKYDNGVVNPYWNDITLFKLVWLKECDTWYELTYEMSQSDKGVCKNITLMRLGEAELSNIHIYGLEINTEASIVLDDYDSNFPVVLYRDYTDISSYQYIWDSDEKYTVYDSEGEIDIVATTALRQEILKHSSMLHRILSFAPHYSIDHVDESIQNNQRIYSFNDKSIYDCLTEIAENESIIFIYDSTTDSDGNIKRSVSVYDALSNCNNCNYRGFFTRTCPVCGSTSIIEGYGIDTTICVSKDILGTDLTISNNKESIANCYHLEGGDDMMTAAIRQCNPNGTGYLWSFTSEMKKEMSNELKEELSDYEALHKIYQTTYEYSTEQLPLSDYNNLVEKYTLFDNELTVEPISDIVGYPELIKDYWNCIDFELYVNHSMMPSISNDAITAQDVVNNLTTETLSPVAVGNLDNLSLAAASTAVLNVAKLISNTIYELKIVTSELSGTIWTGLISATNFYDKDDTAVTQTLTITINDNYQSYVENKVLKNLYNTSQGKSVIVNMYGMTSEQFQIELEKYCFEYLKTINNSFMGAINVLTKIGADKEDNEAYSTIYVPTKEKLDLVQAELLLRESEVSTILDMENGLYNLILETQNELNLEQYLGNSLWIELNSFRREANFSDDNYVSTTFRRKFDYVDSNFVSDTLTNAELIQRAYEFLVQAENKMRENAQYSYQINTTLQNLLTIQEFQPLRHYFQVGNWIRIQDDDGNLFKLRLIDYEFDFNNPETLSVNFSDISKVSNISTIQQFINQSNDVIKNIKKTNNQTNSNFSSVTENLVCDYTISDTYATEDLSTDIESLESEMITEFNVLDGKIEGKISEDEAYSLISQELNKITLGVFNSQGFSTVTISYDGIDISTSNEITLGGDVVFISNLTDGTTVISGDNIKTGNIQSHNYLEPLDGDIYSQAGTKLNLTDGQFISTGFFIDASTGEAYIRNGGYIGDFKILTEADSGLATVEHAQNAWKLRSAKITGTQNTRYYVSLTNHRNLVVSDSAYDPHSDENDVTDVCNVGSKSYPWHYGYFNRYYWDDVTLGTQYFKKTLTNNNWIPSNDSTTPTYRQTIAIPGIKMDHENNFNVAKQFIQVTPLMGTNGANMTAYNNAGIICIRQNTDELVFQAIKIPETGTDVNGVDVYILVQWARPAIDILDPPFNLILEYDADNNEVNLIWHDSNDEMFATWDQTILVRKQGSAPENINDGVQLPLTAYERDKYATSPYIDDADGLNGTYYYAVFCNDTSGEASHWVHDTFEPITLANPVITNITVDIINATITYDLPEIEDVTYKLVYKADSIPQSSTDGTAQVITGTSVTLNELTTSTTFYAKIFGIIDNIDTYKSNSYEFITDRPIEVYSFIGEVEDVYPAAYGISPRAGASINNELASFAGMQKAEQYGTTTLPYIVLYDNNLSRTVSSDTVPSAIQNFNGIVYGINFMDYALYYVNNSLHNSPMFTVDEYGTVVNRGILATQNISSRVVSNNEYNCFVFREDTNGYNPNYGKYIKVDNNFTKTITSDNVLPQSVSNPWYYQEGAKLNSYILFAGGYGGTQSSRKTSLVFGFDVDNETITNPMYMMTDRDDHIAGNINNKYAVFSGGHNNSYTGSTNNNTDFFDENLTKTITNSSISPQWGRGCPIIYKDIVGGYGNAYDGVTKASFYTYDSNKTWKANFTLYDKPGYGRSSAAIAGNLMIMSGKFASFSGSMAAEAMQFYEPNQLPILITAVENGNLLTINYTPPTDSSSQLYCLVNRYDKSMSLVDGDSYVIPNNNTTYTIELPYDDAQYARLYNVVNNYRIVSNSVQITENNI